MSQNKQVLVYGLSSCPYCRRAKEFIQSHHIDFTMVDVDLLSGQEKDDAIRQVKELNPRLSFPTIKIYDAKGVEVYVGLDERAEKALMAIAC